MKIQTMIVRTFSLTLLLYCLYATSFAQVKVAPPFGDHMVLQQNTNVAIWGTDRPNTKITVQSGWNETASVVTDEKGAWKLMIKTGKAGGPYMLEIKGSNTITLEDILLGEVWLCSGQSNMEMPIKGFLGQPIIGSNEILLNSENSQLRLFTVRKKVSRSSASFVEGSWQAANPMSVNNFSAMAYLYGKMLQERLKVPVGIINSSVGGTRVEAWTKREVLDQIGFEYKDNKKDNDKINNNDPSVLYNAMIHPLIPFTIKGVIWYQGETNRFNPEQYRERFSAMIDSWRKEWNVGNFPFYFAQIAPFDYGAKVNSAYLREAQLQTMSGTTNTGMAVTMDIGEKDCIHPAQKKQVAERLAYWAFAKTYGFDGIQYSGPVYKSMSINGNKIEITFDHAPNGVSSFGKALDQFTIAGADKKFYPAKAEIKRGKLTVYAEEVAAPVAVRYAWENYVEGGLFNLARLPASSFRTDTW